MGNRSLKIDLHQMRLTGETLVSFLQIFVLAVPTGTFDWMATATR